MYCWHQDQLYNNPMRRDNLTISSGFVPLVVEMGELSGVGPEPKDDLEEASEEVEAEKDPKEMANIENSDNFDNSVDFD